MSKNLKRYLEECKAAYYEGNPIISDDQYDNLEDICSEDLTVGTNKGRCRHWYKMYSMQKVYNIEEVEEKLGKNNMIITSKLDGAAIAIRYINQYIDSVVTRGNGEYGEDISHLIINKYSLSKLGIPARIKINGAIQITGEVVAPKRIENARNYAAGALNLKDPDHFWLKDTLTFFPYGVRPYITEFHQTDMEWLREAGFTPIWGPDEETEAYPTDGLVHRIMSNKVYEELGYTSNHPRGAVAWKERTEGVKTILLRVDWQTGKSGKVTPVAILDPINIDGAMVSRATLNNPGFIEALDLQIGDAVMVERAGGIIPRIIRKAE